MALDLEIENKIDTQIVSVNLCENSDFSEHRTSGTNSVASWAITSG